MLFFRNGFKVLKTRCELTKYSVLLLNSYLILRMTSWNLERKVKYFEDEIDFIVIVFVFFLTYMTLILSSWFD